MPRSAAPAAAATAVLLLVCVAAISHLNERSRRAELAELSKLASFDRWGIPIDEAVDNAPGPRATRAARKAATDKSMLKVVQELEDKMDTLSAKVNALDAHGATRHAVKQPVQKQAVRVVRDGASEAEMSALKTIDADIQRLIAVDTARASSVAQRKREPRQEDSRKEADEGKEVSKERAAQRLERKALELKEVEQRTMEAVKDAMVRQRAIDLKEAAAETERRRSRPRQTGHSQPPRAHEAAATTPRTSRKHVREDAPESRLPQAHGKWGRRDGEEFDTYMGRSRSRGDDDDLAAAHAAHRRGAHLSTAVAASSHKLDARVGSIRSEVVRLQNREEYLEGQERQALNELPAISNDEAHAQSAVASTMQTLQIAKDRRVLAQRAVADDHYSTGPMQALEDRRTLVAATATEEKVRAKRKDDLHARHEGLHHARE